MPNTKTSDLTLITPTADDRFVVVDMAGPSTRAATAQSVSGGLVYAHLYSGADMSQKIINAMAALDSFGGTIDCSGLTGSQAWGTTINLTSRIELRLAPCYISATVPLFTFSGAGGIRMIGAGRHATFIQYFGTAPNLIEFNTTFCSIESLIIRMYGAQADLNAIAFTAGCFHCYAGDLWIDYDNAGTGLGAAIYINDAVFLRLHNLEIRYAGEGMKIEGETQVGVIASDLHISGTTNWGIKYTRTTANDACELFFTNVVKEGAGKGFLFSSSVANTPMATVMTNCTSDGEMAGSCMEIVNGQNIYMVNSWFASGNPGVPAIKFNGATRCSVIGGTIYGVYGVQFAGANGRIQVMGAAINLNGTLGFEDFHFDVGTTIDQLEVLGNNSAFITNDPTKFKGLFGVPSALTATTVGAAGGAAALPATPTGYFLINVNGTNRKVPYYAV